MSSSEEETFQAVQKVLDPYIRPREEVAYIRRVLALHLDSSLKDGSATAPLALVESSEQRGSPATRGLYKDYLEALATNMKALREYKACAQHAARCTDTQENPQITPSPQERLREHLATLNLQKKQERLQAIEQHLDLLAKKPAASPSFLDPDEVFKYSQPLPEVPKEVVNSLALENTRPDTQLKDLVDQLEKHVLRTKLLLKREEQLLEQVKLRSSAADPRTVTESAKFEALDATRNELIAWIETELGKASGSSEDDDGEAHRASSSRPPDLEGTSRRMDEKLASIKEKYAKYSDARKALLHLVSQQPRPIIKPQKPDNTQSTTSDSASPSTDVQTPIPAPTAHLLAPYLTQLLAIARQQKGLIAQKSHINATVSRQLRDNSQLLDHLADESQLLPAFPMPGSTAARQPTKPEKRFGDGLVVNRGGVIDTSSSIDQVKPWVFAADSAKIATLEAVAERIDEGQMALEGAMGTIGEIERLLGLGVERGERGGGGGEEGDVAGEGGESAVATAEDDDIWLAGSKPSRMSTGGGVARRHVDQSQAKGKGKSGGAERDVWDQLHGNLGLLGGDKEQPP